MLYREIAQFCLTQPVSDESKFESMSRLSIGRPANLLAPVILTPSQEVSDWPDPATNVRVEEHIGFVEK